MRFRLTRVTLPQPFDNGGGTRRAVNVTSGMCAATITTRYEFCGATNILTLAHYPMTVVLYEY